MKRNKDWYAIYRQTLVDYIRKNHKIIPINLKRLHTIKLTKIIEEERN